MSYQSELAALLNSLDFSDAADVIVDKVIGLYESGWLGDKPLSAYEDAARLVVGDDLKKIRAEAERKLNEVIRLVNDSYADLGSDVARSASEVQALARTDLKDWGNYSKGTIESIARVARTGILGGDSVDEMRGKFEALGDKVAGFADTLAKHTVKTNGQACIVAKANEAEVFYYAYTGPPPRDVKGPHRSHVFCIETYKYKKRTFHLDDIKQMRNGQREPVIYNRGGWRCRHSWEPDTFYNPEKHSVYFITVPDGKRDVKIGRHN